MKNMISDYTNKGIGVEIPQKLRHGAESTAKVPAGRKLDEPVSHERSAAVALPLGDIAACNGRT